MKRTLVFVCITLLLGSASYAQQNAPASSPLSRKRFTGPGCEPSPPAQAVVPVPVPIAPDKSQTDPFKRVSFGSQRLQSNPIIRRLGTPVDSGAVSGPAS